MLRDLPVTPPIRHYSVSIGWCHRVVEDGHDEGSVPCQRIHIYGVAIVTLLYECLGYDVQAAPEVRMEEDVKEEETLHVTKVILIFV